MQSIVSVAVLSTHAPSAHAFIVHVRVETPVSSHALSNPSHADHSVHAVAAPHAAPSVSRAQGKVSVSACSTQTPDSHALREIARDRVPVSPQITSDVHSLHSPCVGAGQSESASHPMHASRCSSQCVGALHGSPE
uniref:hypothetical protein n=1 Tax=Sandaracinus sp. TaxID=2024858 RepID=UPI0019D42C83|nr:hypothetical protein [Sandaracinus sp.]